MVFVQSPIAISLRSSNYIDDIAPLEFHGHTDADGIAHIENTGQTAVITFSQRVQQPFIVGGPLTDNSKFIFEQIHFHWADTDESGCEHTLEGRKYVPNEKKIRLFFNQNQIEKISQRFRFRYSMEAHIVHFNSKYENFKNACDKSDGLVVTAFFIQASGSKNCKEFQKITDGIRCIRRPQTKQQIDSGCSPCTIFICSI